MGESCFSSCTSNYEREPGQMKQYFVHFTNWASQGDMDTKKVMITEGSKSHRINITYPLSNNLCKILSICLKGYPYLEVASKILLFIQITHIPLKKVCAYEVVQI